MPADPQVAAAVIGAVVGALLGIVTTMIVEAWWRPLQARRAIATSLAAELAGNASEMRSGLGVIDAIYDTKRLPGDLQLSTSAYSALQPRLGELGVNAAVGVTNAYRAIEAIRAIGDEDEPDEPDIKTSADRRIERVRSAARETRLRSVRETAKTAELTALYLIAKHPIGWRAFVPEWLRRWRQDPALAEISATTRGFTRKELHRIKAEFERTLAGDESPPDPAQGQG